MGAKMENGIHNTGQPDTPVEVLVDILGKALQANDPSETRKLVESAHKLAKGLDPYLDAISTPPSEVHAVHQLCQDCSKVIRLHFAGMFQTYCF